MFRWMDACEDEDKDDDVGRKETLTPSSTGTEKNSTPVAFAIASPPGTPGR